MVSECGRTFRENGDRGTDHGHGSIYWVLGGGVSGGRMAGDQVALSAATLNQNRDLPVLTDYRALIGGLGQRQFGLSGDRLATVFPDTRPADFNLVLPCPIATGPCTDIVQHVVQRQPGQLVLQRLAHRGQDRFQAGRDMPVDHPLAFGRLAMKGEEVPGLHSLGYID